MWQTSFFEIFCALSWHTLVFNLLLSIKYSSDSCIFSSNCVLQCQVVNFTTICPCNSSVMLIGAFCSPSLSLCQSVIGLCCSYYLFVNLFAPMATNYSVKFFSGDTSQKFPRIQKVSKRRGRQVIGVKFETFSTSFTQGNVFPVTIHKVTIFFRQH